MTKVVVGLSGGVDSSVAAYLLTLQGYEVHGVLMKNWEEDDTDSFCSAAADIQDAQSVCDKLNIPFTTINFAAEYWDRVFEYFLAEYRAGRTPNPDILCNKEIKFKAFSDYAKTLNADFIATGHYARRAIDNQHYQLLRGVDNNKDQSYFLYTLGQAQLSKSLFPIGELAKPEVRKIAKTQGFVTHDKKDSTGICFIGERKFKTFLERYLPAKPGEIQTPTGQVIGQHDGLMYYTIGQRQGLKLGGIKDAKEAPWYVAQKDLEHNRLIVVQDHDHPLLLRTELMANQLHWVSGFAPDQHFSCTAKVRYRQQDSNCEVYIDGDKAKVVFSTPQRAITAGQSVVFYQQQVCLGGGVIL